MMLTVWILTHDKLVWNNASYRLTGKSVEATRDANSSPASTIISLCANDSIQVHERIIRSRTLPEKLMDRSFNQEIYLLWNPKVHYRVHWYPS
jgi:hypothetical protein